ncbi:MAG TPA: UDP-N-acetylglucosamine 1-carboxyvinyltransferase [Bacilli bacterium]
MKVKVRGKRRLQGVVEISGAKNSAVAIIPAAVLADEPVTIRNIPDIQDVRTLIGLLQEIGYSVSFNDNVLEVKQLTKIDWEIKSEEVKKLRGSYYFMGAFLGKLKKVKMFTSGGCNLGHRPINFHLEGFRKLGASVKEDGDQITISAAKLEGTTIDLDFPSVGATINLMLAAVKAKGETIINNAAIEPEITDVGNFLISMGANIAGLGTSTIKIKGVKYLHRTDYTISPDRIEAGTFLILGALSKGKGITIRNVDADKMTALINLLKGIGCRLEIGEKEIFIKSREGLRSFHIVTKPYPGFPTDLGQLITVLMLVIEGESSLKETIFSNRFSHVNELKKMGADIRVEGDTIYVNGPCKLKKATLTAHDLRCAAALILASTLNPGITIIENIDVLLRGYENPIQKFRCLGLNINIE